MIDLQYLGKALTEAGLTGKAVNQYSKEEVEVLVHHCINSLRPEKSPEFKRPWIDEDGCLQIPAESDPRFHWWKKCGQSIYSTLRELGASEEVFRRYTAIEHEAPF